MKLSELLNPGAVTLRLKGRSKREVLVELVALLESSHGFASQGEILDRVLRREAMMSTGLFPGAAIPHGKARSVDRMAAACGLSLEGVDFESEDGQPTHLFVLLVSPENATTPHVRLLANISRLLKDDNARRGMLEARSADEFLAAVVRGESAFGSQG
jgi:mannitol/fructose-specific phosphotransferase system IIA component (Ntr-type)